MYRNHKGVLRKAGAVALAAASIAAIGLAAPGFAHPHPDGDGEAKKIEKVVILERSKDGKPGEHVEHFLVHRDGKPGERRVIRVEGNGKPGEHVREFHIKRDGKPGAPGEHVRAFRMLHDGKIECPGGARTEVDEQTGGEDSKQKTRIVLCHDDKLTGAERAAKLEQTLERLRSNDRPSGEHKAKVEAAIQSAIDKLRASN